MATFKNTLIAASMVIAVAGCSHKKTPLPLPPGGNGDIGNGQGDEAPGTPGDFRRSVVSDTINFALDQYDIDARSRQILDSQAAWLVRFPDVRITIEGHCDERGTREYNLALGDRRANAAKNYLAARGVAAGRISTISYGKEQPIAMGSDESSWARNRRAVTIVLN